MTNRAVMIWGAVLLAACSGSATAGPATTGAREAGADMMVIRVVVRVQPEHVDAFVAHMRAEALEVRALEGCRRYELFRDPEEAGRFLLYEEWASPEAFEAYRQSELLRASFAVLGPMMAGPPDSAYYAASPQAVPR